MKRFEDFNLKEKTMQLIAANHFTVPTPIQEQIIPYVLKGKDVIGLSHTGTGKTHAYLIPVMEMVESEKEEVQFVITAPTRELAYQIYDKALLLKKIDSKLRIGLYVGGKDRLKDIKQLEKAQPQIVIGTPGRIKDLFLQEGLLRIEKAKQLIVDEADMTLEYGFLDDIDAFAGRMQDNLQMLAFSATMPDQLKPFLKKYMHHPLTIRIADETRFEPNIQHILVPCYHHSFSETILRMLDGFQPYTCLIFANTRELVEEIANDLRKHQVAVTEIHGNLESRQRKKALKQLANSETTYVVATDLAARGIDIPTVTHVISCGFPNELDFYIHRAGRTARAGADGICYALYHEEDAKAITSLMKRGIHFGHMRYHGHKWQTLQPYAKKRVHTKDAQMEKEIAKLKTKKNSKVKPGYKKKHARAVQELERKKRRDFIRAKIKEEKKAMYKERAIKKRNDA
ncbi:MAG: DEAD/DEAH box helicase [Solobacterium sp.]|nr:DEAD/DEAH box helicase [Solobacterium sp.]